MRRKDDNLSITNAQILRCLSSQETIAQVIAVRKSLISFYSIIPVYINIYYGSTRKASMGFKLDRRQSNIGDSYLSSYLIKVFHPAIGRGFDSKLYFFVRSSLSGNVIKSSMCFLFCSFKKGRPRKLGSLVYLRMESVLQLVHTININYSVPIRPGDWKVSELESVRINFLPILSKIGKCQNWKVSELESVRNCSVWKVSELESVRTCLDWKVSETVEIGKCQNWKVSEIAQIGKCQKQLRLESVSIGKCQKLLRLERVRNCSD